MAMSRDNRGGKRIEANAEIAEHAAALIHDAAKLLPEVQSGTETVAAIEDGVGRIKKWMAGPMPLLDEKSIAVAVAVAAEAMLLVANMLTQAALPKITRLLPPSERN